MGEELPSIMARRTDPLSIMLGENLLNRFYQSLASNQSGNQDLLLYADKSAHQNPHLRILEVGAGTGSATVPILSVLGGQDQKRPRFLS